MPKQIPLPKDLMKPIIFKGKDKTTIEVFFKTNEFGFQPILASSKRAEAIPLLMDLTQIIATNRKLHLLNKEKEFPFEYLRNVVAGACSLTMKRGF